MAQQRQALDKMVERVSSLEEAGKRQDDELRLKGFVVDAGRDGDQYRTNTAPGKAVSVQIFPSSEIDRGSLLTMDEVVHKYHKLVKKGKVQRLALKLAHEAAFGKEVLKRCSLNGKGNYPALPAGSLNSIKQTILDTFPKYQKQPFLFESAWRRCMRSIGHSANSLRRQEGDKTSKESASIMSDSP